MITVNQHQYSRALNIYATPSNSESTWYRYGHSHNKASLSPTSNSASYQYNPYPVDTESDTNGLASKIDNGNRGHIMVYYKTRSAVLVIIEYLISI